MRAPGIEPPFLILLRIWTAGSRDEQEPGARCPLVIFQLRAEAVDNESALEPVSRGWRPTLWMRGYARGADRSRIRFSLRAVPTGRLSFAAAPRHHRESRDRI